MAAVRLPADPWSIGIFAGRDPFHLVAPAHIPNPVLMREDIFDVVAAFIADPFLLYYDGVWHLFFEVLNQVAQKGEIGWASSDDTIAWTYRGIVLREPYHLSYPYVFEHGGDVFMVPETLGAASVRLYRGEPFPTRWVYQRDLIPASLADPSMLFFQGKWWLFACPRPNHHDALSLYWANALTGPWIAHPLNPLIHDDQRNARPAGRVLVDQGRAYRLAQDCVARYGHQVRAFEITILTDQQYLEREHPNSPILTGSGAGWNGKAMHHVDAHQVRDGLWIAAVDGLFLPPGC